MRELTSDRKFKVDFTSYDTVPNKLIETLHKVSFICLPNILYFFLQFCETDGLLSDMDCITDQYNTVSGVTQGSTLGPFFKQHLH